MDDPGLTGLCKDFFMDTKAEVGREARRGAVGSSSRVDVWMHDGHVDERVRDRGDVVHVALRGTV